MTVGINISAQDSNPDDKKPDLNSEEKEIERLDEGLDHLCEELKKLKELLEADRHKEE